MLCEGLRLQYLSLTECNGLQSGAFSPLFANQWFGMGEVQIWWGTTIFIKDEGIVIFVNGGQFKVMPVCLPLLQTVTLKLSRILRIDAIKGWWYISHCRLTLFQLPLLRVYQSFRLLVACIYLVQRRSWRLVGRIFIFAVWPCLNFASQIRTRLWLMRIVKFRFDIRLRVTPKLLPLLSCPFLQHPSISPPSWWSCRSISLIQSLFKIITLN